MVVSIFVEEFASIANGNCFGKYDWVPLAKLISIYVSDHKHSKTTQGESALPILRQMNHAIDFVEIEVIAT